jgi:hypothetical protein
MFRSNPPHYDGSVMTKISGIIIPTSWDAKGNITGMAIATNKEEEYQIEDDDIGARLRSYLRQEVKITGILKNKRGKEIIKIKKITSAADYRYPAP